MDMMMRRRAMMKSGGAGPLPKWDIEWSYEDGFPDADGLFTKTTSGTASEHVYTGWTQLTCKGSSAYIKFTETNIGYGDPSVFECHLHSGQTNNFFFFMALSADGTNGIAIRLQRSTNYQGIYLVNASTLAACTKLKTFGYDQDHVIRLEINGGYGAIYDNNELLMGNIDTSTILSADATCFQYGAQSNTSVNGYLKYMKIKY